jgi:hypothetical protein
MVAAAAFVRFITLQPIVFFARVSRKDGERG